jgi:cellulose synthase/poly-beta-1,6-N-acetylglucosamine synthase-like glycosyltransferase
MLYLAVACLGALAFIWLLYPAGVILAAARRPRVTPVTQTLPTVTVVIATREALDVIVRRVRDVLAGDYPAECLDVIVAIDARSDRATPEDVLGALAGEQGARRVAVIRGGEPGGKAAALNTAVAAATGDVVVVTDSFTACAPGAIRAVVAPFADARVGAVSGHLALPGSDDGARTLIHHYWRWELELRRAQAALGSCVGVVGPFNAVRRTLWEPLPEGTILDDVYHPMDLVLRGWRVVFAPEARAYDLRPPVAGNEYRRKVRTLTGVLQLCAWRPELLVPGRNPLWVHFVCHKLLRLLTPWLLVGALLGIGAIVTRAAWQLAPEALLVTAGVGALALLLHATLRRAVTRVVVWGGTLQAAVVVATFNGLRGEWNVWRR